MDSALPRVQSRVFVTAVLAATLAIGCGDDGDPDGVGQTASPAASTGGLTGGGAALPPGVGGTIGAGPVQQLPTPVDAGVAVVQQPTTGGTSTNTDTPWCKVKAILDAKCVACHTTPLAAGAPFPLTKYEDLIAAHPSKPGKKVFERVGVRVHADKSQLESLPVMPPGAQLPAASLAVIDSWVAAGAPVGENPTCKGAAGAAGADAGVASGEGAWPPAECDQVYKIVAKAAGGGKMSVTPGAETHPQVSIPAPWGSEKVQAIAFKTITDNPLILHHWILNGGGAFLTGWAPGEDGVRLMAPDVGMDMPSGNLRLDMHYNSLQATKTEQDSSGVEVCVVKGTKMRKNHAAVTMGLSSLFNLSVPAGAVNHEVKSSCTVGTGPVTLLSASPHAHQLAVRMLFTVKKKSGTLITMHDMPFMFGEQKSFKLDPPVVVEAGDVINTSCFYTNKTNKTVTFGENTGNEMCFNFALYYPAGALSCGAGGVDIGSLFGGGT